MKSKESRKLFGVLFKEQKVLQPVDLVSMFSEWGQVVRKEGLLSLEAQIIDVDDPFLKNGLNLAIDGQSGHYIRDVLSEEIDAMKERHQTGASIFALAGTYAPTLGVLGAVIGLIAALGEHGRYRYARTCDQRGVCCYASWYFYWVCTMASVCK